MAAEHPFWLFQDNQGIPTWRASFMDLDGAKRVAQELADHERHEFFIRRFDDFSEIARVFPALSKGRTDRTSGTGSDSGGTK